MKKGLLIVLFFVAAAFSPQGEEFCGGIRNFSFRDGEQVDFHVFYTVIGIYVHAAQHHMWLIQFW